MLISHSSPVLTTLPYALSRDSCNQTRTQHHQNYQPSWICTHMSSLSSACALCFSLFLNDCLPWLSPSSIRSFSLAAQSLSAVVSLFHKNHALITDLPQGTAPFLCSHSKQGRRHHWVVSRYCLHFFTCHSFTHGNYIPVKPFMSRSRETYYLNQPLGSTVTSDHSPSSDTFFPWFLSYKTIWLSA